MVRAILFFLGNRELDCYRLYGWYGCALPAAIVRPGEGPTFHVKFSYHLRLVATVEFKPSQGFCTCVLTTYCCLRPMFEKSAISTLVKTTKVMGAEHDKAVFSFSQACINQTSAQEC